jgi:hypothetical protein
MREYDINYITSKVGHRPELMEKSFAAFRPFGQRPVIDIRQNVSEEYNARLGELIKECIWNEVPSHYFKAWTAVSERLLQAR